MQFGSDKRGESLDLSSVSAEKLIERIVKGALEGAVFSDHVDALDVPNDVKYALIRSANSYKGRIDAVPLIESLAPGSTVKADLGRASTCFDHVDWAAIGEVFNRAKSSAATKRTKPSPPMRTKKKSVAKSWVYFIESKNSQLIKIGYSINPEQRFKEIKTMSPDQLEMIGKFEGGKAEEAVLHEKFAHLRAHGEWFQNDAELRECITSKTT